MTLRELLEGVEVASVEGSLDVAVSGVAYDSRRVSAGDAFFALAGARNDGHAFARSAVDAGAVAVIGPRLALDRATMVEVADPRLALARAAAHWHGHPSRALEVVGVTGTNGKTTTTWMLESILRAAGRVPGVIGTTGYRVAGESRPAPFTTPEAPELQALLATMRERGVGAVAMEVSSHALVQRRAFGVEFDVVVFTNLTQDHLDYHGTMDAYLDAKLMLFDGRNGGTRKPRTAVVNADDAAAPRVVAAAQRGGAVVRTYSTSPVPPSGGADVHVTRIAPGARGLELVVMLGSGGAQRRLRLELIGRYNASNAAAAMSAALALGIDANDAVAGLEGLAGVPGRLEPVDAGQPFLVLVDYAHTPDALGRALASVREHVAGRVLLVFGCGGDRDRGKRPLMGRAAAEGADRAWVTSDNPRGEDPTAIVREVVAGAPGATLAVELDRRAAIAAALADARPGDAVLVAGKGHETTQTIGDRVLPFDDRQVARELLAKALR